MSKQHAERKQSTKEGEREKCNSDSDEREINANKRFRSTRNSKHLVAFIYSIPYNLALPLLSSLAFTTFSQANSPIGCLASAFSLAFALLACLTAHRAAIPWKIHVALKNPNATPHFKSGVASQPATSPYHLISCSCVGRPGREPGAN